MFQAPALIRAALLCALLMSLSTVSAGAQDVHYFRGVVTDDARPASRGTIELALTEQSDTAMAGWMRVGPPLRGSGFAYAELPGGDSLELVSVSPAADTIIWQSATRGRALKGRYRILGGKLAGQTGSWSLEAARNPGQLRRVALAVVFGLAVIVAILFQARRVAPGWWRRRVAPSVDQERRAQLTGIGGWLVWFLFIQTVAVILLLVRLRSVGSTEGGASWLMGDVISSLRPLIVLEESIQVAQPVGMLVGLVLLARRRPEAPVFWAMLLAMLGTYAVVDIVATSELGYQFAHMFGENARREFLSNTATESRQNTRLLATAMIWGLYWLISRRVRFTFAPPGTLPPPVDLPTPEPVLPTVAPAVDLEAAPSETGAVPLEAAVPLDDAPALLADTPRSGPTSRRKLVAFVLFAAAAVGVVVWAGVASSRSGDAPTVHPNDSAAVVPPGSKLSPREIALAARAATVQLRALDVRGAVIGEGTGFFLSDRGLIATNLHVIRGAHALQVQTLSGRKYDSVLFVAADARRDVALLKIAVSGSRSLPLSSDVDIEVGERVYVMGNPLGQSGTFSDGLVSARRVVDGVSLLQITAPVSPGSSGGPVLNDRGQVVGVTTLMLRGGQNLNYAVLVNYLRPLLSRNAPPRPYSASMLPRDTGGGLSTIEVTSRRRSADLFDTTRGTDSSGRSGLDAIAGQFIRGDSMMQSTGALFVGDIRRGALKERASATHAVTLTVNQEYAVLGYCDNNCGDLDLRIYGPNGALLDADLERDDHPYIRFMATTGGTYRIRVVMTSCTLPTCGYGVRLYSF